MSDNSDSEGEFSYGDSVGESTQWTDEFGRQRTEIVQNKPYDEALELSDNSMEESIDTNAAQSTSFGSPQGKQAVRSRANAGQPEQAEQTSKIEESNDEDTPREQKVQEHPSPPPQPADAEDQHEQSMESESPSDDERSTSFGGVAGGYNPEDYAHLQVPQDIKGLFEYISGYRPHDISLETQLKPFIPDYIPAVGEIDAFVKPPPPKSEEEPLGLKELDEPSPHQSDPTVLDLQLRSMSKKSNIKPTKVRSIENANKNPREITKWINSIQELHRNKPAPQVQYSKAMPDIEALMQVWPDEMEEKIRELTKTPGSVFGKPSKKKGQRDKDQQQHHHTTGPLAEMDLSLEEMTRVMCAMLDIPVYEPKAGTPASESRSLIQSLHVFFTLYNEFRTNQHFQQIGGMTGGASLGQTGSGANVLAVDSDDENENKQ